MARQYQVKPLLVLTTLGEDGQFSGERAHLVLQNPSTRAALIDNLVQTPKNRDMPAWTLILSTSRPEDAESYTAFIREGQARGWSRSARSSWSRSPPKTSAGAARATIRGARLPNDWRGRGLCAADDL